MNSIFILFASAILCSAIAHPQYDLPEPDLSCRPDNSTFVCSGRGVCVQGICECDKRANPEEMIVGKYCECDNFSCVRYQGLVCGGPDHGTCTCGTCLCKPGWMGEDCNCPESSHYCVSPEGGDTCSGHGQCICGVCQCERTNDSQYTGKYCENMPKIGSDD